MRKLQRLNLFLLLSLLACIGFSSTSAHAQTVTFKLKNGDRITGLLLSENTNSVVVTNTWAKEFSIPLAEIESRETNVSPAAVTAIPTPAPSPVPPPAPATNAPVVAKEEPAPAKVAAVPPPKPEPKKKAPSPWNGDVQIGADLGIGQTRRELYHGRFKITYAPTSDSGVNATSSNIDRFRNTFDFNAAYGTITRELANGDEQRSLSANRMDGSSKTDFDLGAKRKFFVYNLVGAGYDEIRRIDLRYEVGPGLGYHVFNRSNMVLNAELGLNYQVQHFENGTETERFYYRLAEDFTWKISKTMSFDEKLEIFPQVNFADYRLRFESNLRYWLRENISFNLTVIDLYDSQPAPNVDNNDLQVRSSIGLKF